MHIRNLVIRIPFYSNCTEQKSNSARAPWKTAVIAGPFTGLEHCNLLAALIRRGRRDPRGMKKMSSNQYFDSARPKEEPEEEKRQKSREMNGMGWESKSSGFQPCRSYFLTPFLSFPHSLFFVSYTTYICLPIHLCSSSSVFSPWEDLMTKIVVAD